MIPVEDGRMKGDGEARGTGGAVGVAGVDQDGADASLAAA
jgi:hypothetical protein